jgi:uncharacterized membrane protein YfcA
LTGFGSGLLMVPLMALFLDMKVIVPTGMILAVLSGFLLLFTFQTRKWIRKELLLFLISGAIVGTVLGTYALASYNSQLIKRFLGIFISGYALKMLFEGQSKIIEIKNYIGVITGFLSGILGGMFGTGGPPVVIYLRKKILDKQEFRATLIFYFLITNSWQFTTYCFAGLVNRNILKFTIYLLPAFIVGNLIGTILHIKINQNIFNKIIALVLIITGIFLII